MDQHMTQFPQDRRQYDLLLEKVIHITEENLKAQREYLYELTLIKNRFDINDRDHADVKQSLTHITNNTFEMLNKMNRASNEEIIELLEEGNKFRTDLTYRFTNAENNIKALNDKFLILPNIYEEVKTFGKKISEVKDTFSLIQKILGAILILVAGVQIAAIAWNTLKSQNIENNIKNIIQYERKQKNEEKKS